MRLGGRLVLSVGSQAKQVLAEDAPLATICSRQVCRERFAQSHQCLGIIRRDDGSADAAVSGTVDEFTLESRGWKTFVARSKRSKAHGLATCRLWCAPRADWRGVVRGRRSRPTAIQHMVGATHLLDKLLGGTKRNQTHEVRTAPVAAASYGYNDLAGQTASALEQFPQVRLAPFGLVAGLVALYIVAIGPVDYFLVRRLFRRAEWTWLTFRRWSCCSAAQRTGSRHSFKGSELRVNQIDMIDYDAETKLVRGTTLEQRVQPVRRHLQPKLRSAASRRCFPRTGTGSHLMEWPAG